MKDYYVKKTQTKIKKINIATDKRVLLVSDIHADLELFKRSLEELGFNKEDFLFILGDIIEKGPENIKTLDYIFSLLDNEYNIFLLAGNWDESLSKTLRYSIKQIMEYKPHRFNSSIINEILKRENLLLEKLSKETLEELILTKYAKYYNFLENLDHVLIINDKLYLSHGGIDDLSNISNFKDDILKNNYFYNKGFFYDKWQAVGHLPVNNYNLSHYNLNPIIDLDKKVLCIDGGVGTTRFNQLNVLIINSLDEMSFSYKSFDSYEEVLVKEDYLGNEVKSFYLKFGQYYFDILKEEMDYYLVKLHIYDKQLYVYKKHVNYDKKGHPFIFDALDLFLSLEKGSKVSLCIKAYPFSYIKKDGVAGLCLTKLLDI